MNSFSLSILAVDQVLLRCPVQSCQVQDAEGSRTLEAHHSHYIGVLASPGRVKVVDTDGLTREFNLESAVLDFSGNNCVIVCSHQALP